MRVHRRRSGNVAIIMAFSMTAIMLFAAMAIDVSYLRTTQFELQNAADAAAHAALADMRLGMSQSEATERALQLGALNSAAGSGVDIDRSDVLFGQWDYSTSTFIDGAAPANAVQVTTRREDGAIDGPVRLLLGPYVGVPNGQARARATGAFRSRDIVVVQDITGSFTEEMDDAAAADVEFLKYLRDHMIAGDQVGMVVFGGGAAEFTRLQDLSLGYGSILAQWEGDGKSNFDNTKVSGITNCYQTDSKGKLMAAPWQGIWMGLSCQSALNGVCTPAGGATCHASGIALAQSMLSRYGDANNLPIIVMMSDGRPQCPYVSSACDAARGVVGTTAADTAYTDHDVSIYTLLFEHADLGSTQALNEIAYMKSLSRGYGVGHEKVTPTKEQLDNLMVEIAANIPIALVE